MATFRLDAIGVTIGIDVPNPRVEGIWLALKIPKGVVTQLLDRAVDVTLYAPNGDRRTESVLLTADAPSYLSGELHGNTYVNKYLSGDKTVHRGFYFSAAVDFSNVDYGQIKLPDMKISDRIVQGPLVPFRRVPYATIAPLNGC